jgi:hypothetical protein
LALLGALLAAGCIGPQNGTATTPPAPGTDSGPLGACPPPVVVNTPSGGGQSAVSNGPGAFSYGGQVAVKTANEDYPWTNPSPTARASFGGQAATGTLRIVVKDACSKVEMDKTVGPGQGGDYGALPAGTPGKWLVSLEFSAFTGQMGLSITS